ncbi:MAG: hypothetical protein ACXVGR_13990 [Mycobacteriaceae bacterium]
MKVRNASVAVVGLAFAGALAVPASASAASAPSASVASVVSIAPTAKLGLQGASAIISVNYRCTPDSVNPYLSTRLAQARGRAIAHLDGAPDSPPVCDGKDHTVSVLMDGNTIPLKKGSAAAIATLSANVGSPSGPFYTVSTGYVPMRLR